MRSKMLGTSQTCRLKFKLTYVLFRVKYQILYEIEMFDLLGVDKFHLIDACYIFCLSDKYSSLFWHLKKIHVISVIILGD